MKKVLIDCATILRVGYKGLTGLRLLIAVAMKSNGGICGASLRTLAAQAHMSESTATTHMKRLVEYGFIQEFGAKGRTWRAIVRSADNYGQIEIADGDPLLALISALSDNSGRLCIERPTLMELAHTTNNTLVAHLGRLEAGGFIEIERSRKVLSFMLLPLPLPPVSKIDGSPLYGV